MPSQVIAGFSYDAPTRTLFIAFTSGDLYAYLDVPPQIPPAFRDSPSKGRYFAANIRGRFAYRRMDPDAGAAAVRLWPRGPSGPVSPPPAAAER